MFVLEDTRKLPWHRGERATTVITYHDVRGERYFFIHPCAGRYDMRIVVQGDTTADQSNVSAKQIETTARTLGIDLTEDRLELLARSTSSGLRTRVSQ